MDDDAAASRIGKGNREVASNQPPMSTTSATPMDREQLRVALEQARSTVAGSRSAVLLYGPAGIGKSTLVEQVFAAPEEGVFGLGKGEQFGSTHPYRPLIDALTQALTGWLSQAGPAALDSLRGSLGDFAPVLLPLFPPLAAVWPEMAHESPGEEGRGQVPFALRALVLALGTVTAPIVLALDDLQWVDDETLHRIELGLSDPDQKGLLGIFCCRDSPAALRRAREFLARLQASGASTLELRVFPLNRDEVGQVLARELGPTEDDEGLAKLVDKVCRSSNGSPLFVHHAVGYLASGGDLDWGGLADDDRLPALLTQRLGTLDPVHREVLALAACAGSSVSRSVLRRAAAKTHPMANVPLALEQASRAGLVSLSDGVVRMSHDRVQEACAGNPTGWPARHLALWEAGVEELDQPEQASDEQLFWLVDRQIQAASFLSAHPLRSTAISLALVASRRARLRAASSVAVKACTLAQRLLLPEDDDSLRARVAVEHAVATWLSGDATRFELLADEAERIATPLELVPVTMLRLQAHTARGKMGLALQLAEEAVLRLCPALEGTLRDPTDWSQDPETIEQLLSEAAHMLTGNDELTRAIGGLLGTAKAAAYVAAPERLPGLVRAGFEQARAHGAPPTFPLTLACWAALLATRQETLGQALRAGRLALSLAAGANDEVVRARTSDLAYGMVLCWQGDFREVIVPLEANSRLARRHGTYEYAGYSLLKSLAYRLFAGADLTALAADLEEARKEMVTLGQRRIARYLERDAVVVKRLLIPGPDPSSLADRSFNLAQLLAELQASDDHYGLLYTAVARRLLAVVYEQTEAAQQLARQAHSHVAGGHGLVHQAMLCWLEGLALLAGNGPLPTASEQRARHCLDRLEQLTEHARVIWGPRASLLQAELERRLGQPELARQAYTQAEAAAERASLPLDLYLIRRQRALLSGEDAESWRRQADQALRLWRGAPRHEMPTVADGVCWAARVVNASSEQALGLALSELLRGMFPTARFSVVRQGGTVLASWQAGPGFATEQLEEILRKGRRLESELEWLGVPILVGDRVAGAIVLRDGGGFPEHVLPRLHDISTLAGTALANLGEDQALSAWSEREALYTTLMQESPAGLFARDRQGLLIWANVAYSRALGVPLHELLGRRLVDSLPSVLAEQQQAECQSVVDEERPLETLVAIPQPEGGHREYVVHRTPLRDTNGRVIGMCGVSTEVTELRRAQEELERGRRLRAVGEFAAHITHDLNNLVHIICCNAELLEMSLGRDPRWTEELSNISLAGARARELGQRITMLGQAQSTPSQTPLDLVALLEDSVRLMRSRLPDTVGLELSTEPLEGKVLGDALQLSRVLDNLLSNAWQALPPEGGSIDVTLLSSEGVPEEAPGETARSSRYALLKVTDSGKGIDSATLSRIFDPYFTTKGEGTGLGLSIVHAVVQGMGGSITVSSRPGLGSSFSVYLPLTPDAAEASQR
jgi:PAS domain S-box-containing protein